VPMSRRSFAALASVVLTGLGLLVLLPDCASACSCAPSPGAERALSSSEAVFSGKVVEIDRPSEGPGWSSGDPETDTFRVSESWKGPE
jgi:hypothetical protein